MSFQEGTAMAAYPDDKSREYERELHSRSLAVEIHGFRISSAAARARLYSRGILLVGAATSLVLLFLGTGMFGLVAWLGVLVVVGSAVAYIHFDCRHELKRADKELQAALTSVDEPRSPSGAHG